MKIARTSALLGLVALASACGGPAEESAPAAAETQAQAAAAATAAPSAAASETPTEAAPATPAPATPGATPSAAATTPAATASPSPRATAAASPAATPTRVAAAAPAASTARGKALFNDWSCGTCHALADAGASGSIGPALDRNPRLSREHIVHIVTSGQGAMPAFGGQMSDDEIAAVAAYIMAAKK